MKTHTNSFKEQIKLIGKEIDSRITFGDTVLGKNDLNAVTPSYQGALLKSIMKQLDIDSNVVIPIGTILTYEFGLRVNGKYEYINYGNYVVYSIEKQEDTNSYKITCYDKMLFAMRDYVKMPITYPITIRDYINSLCTFLGLPFANKNDTFANYDKKIQNELYLDADGNSLGYTFRDVFDELAQVTASEICLNNNSEVEIRYINDAFNINKASGLGNVSFDDAIEEDIKLLVIDGKSTQNGTPTPDTPVEIESVGYTNLIPTSETEWEQGTINGGNNEDSTTRLRTKNYIEINDDTLHTFRLENALIGNVWFYDEQKQVVNNLYDMIYKTGMKSVEFTTPKNTKYYKVVIRYEDNSVITPQGINEIKPMLEEDSVTHSYIPYGKYGIEVKIVGKNLFDGSKVGIYFNASGQFGTSAKSLTTKNIIAKAGDTFTIISSEYTDGLVIASFDVNNVLLERSALRGVLLTHTCPENTSYIVASNILGQEQNTTLVKGLKESLDSTEYEPYQEKTSVLQLNAPLRSLPNGVKDIAYIKNNKLYVDRYVGSVILNGSENWLRNANDTNYYRLVLTVNDVALTDNNSTDTKVLSNYFVGSSANDTVVTNPTKNMIAVISNNRFMVNLVDTDLFGVVAFKTWLSQNNVQVDYELATPITEELGEISIKTLDGTNNINLLAKIETNFEMEYITGIDTIDEEFLKDINVNFGEKFGAINTIVLTRSGGSDSIYYPETLPDNPVEIKIEDNQIMNFNNRDEFLHDIYEKLNGLEYYLNDFSSTGITYYDLCDRYNVKVGDNIYSCVMFNDEVLVTQGLEENIFTEMPKETKTDYTKADKTDRKINQVSLIVDKQNQIIQSIASKVADISNVITGIGSVTLENAHEGILHKLVITGNISLNYPSSNNNLYGYSLFPNENLTPKANLTPSIGVPFNHGTLYPSTTLYPKSFKLQVDENVYNLDINYLNYLNSNVYDEFVYEDGNCYIVRRIGIDETGKMYELPSEIFEERKDVLINVLENSKITLLGFGDAILTAEYLLQNQYTDVFATEAYVNSEIKQTADEINIEVAKKVNDDEVVSAINLSPEKISLKSNRLEIDSTYFKLSEDGKIESTSGKIGGFELEKNRLKVTHIPEQSEFTKEDLTIVNDYLKNGKPLSPEQIIKYDLNGDGQVTAVDLLKLQNIVLVKNQNVNIEINSDDFENFINVESDNFGTSFNVSLSGTTINSLTTNNITVKDNLENESLKIFEDGTILADMTNSEGGAWTIQNFGSQVFTVNKNGQIECVSLTQTSQEKYKKNFEKLENALDIINDTDIYKYNLKTQNNDDKKHIGFVIGDNYKYSEEITSGENEGVDIYSMVSVCFKAIQEQQEQIKMLKNEINQLKEMIK